MDELRRFFRGLVEQGNLLLELSKDVGNAKPLTLREFYEELKQASHWLYLDLLDLKKDLITIYMRIILKLTDYTIVGIFKLAILLEGLLDGGNYKAPGVAMDNLITLVFRGLSFVSYLVGSFVKLHTWLTDMSLSQLISFVFNNMDYPLWIKILWFLLLLLSKLVLFLLSFFF